MASMASRATIDLISGHTVPIIGFGTFQIKNYDELYKAIEAALGAGYRSFDTAAVYRNEEFIGKIFKELLPKSGLKREDIFITSKLAPADQGKDKAIAACQGSIDRLDCGYLDLYLIHWPGTQKLQPNDPKQKENRKQSWMDLEDAFKSGKCKSIGVSNYLVSHLEELLSYATIKPAVLQTEYHPHLIQADVKKFCDANNIHFQAYSSLGTSNAEKNKLICDPVVKQIADSIKKSPAQVLLRWAVQQNIGVIPKSITPSRIVDNMDIFSFSLSDDHMNTLFNLDVETHYCWDPASIM